jgi:hypothetical protein
VFSPPLGWGAPRWLKRSDPIVVVRRQGEASFVSSLGDAVDQTLLDDSIAGWETARTRLAGIEARAGTFVQAAALTNTLVLVNQGLVSGDHPVRHTPAKWLFLAAIVIASVALVIAGLYGLFATMRTFDRIAPNNVARIIGRSQREAADNDPAGAAVLAREAMQQDIAAALMAQRRTSFVADWKLARLKRATVFFGIAIAAIAVASGIFLVDATTHNNDTPASTAAGTASTRSKSPAFPDLAAAKIQSADNASFIYTIPPFGEHVSGVVHFVTRDRLPVPGSAQPQHVALATKAVEARKDHQARVRVALSRRARGALADRRTLRVGVRLEVRGDTGLSGYDARSCITLDVTQGRTHTGC